MAIAIVIFKDVFVKIRTARCGKEMRAMEVQTSQEPEKITVSEDHKIVFWGSQVRHCNYCGISQPFTVYAMHEQPDITDDLNIEGIYRAHKNLQEHGYNPNDNKHAHYMAICLFCKKAVHIDPPKNENVAVLWEEVDGYHSLAALTLDETPDEPREISQVSASKFFRNTKGWLFSWFWKMSATRVTITITLIVLSLAVISAEIKHNPENTWLPPIIFLLIVSCLIAVPKLLAFLIFGNPLTPKVHAHLLPFSLDLATIEHHARSAGYSTVANAIKPLAAAQADVENKEQEDEI